jgi:hypothetical protein
VLSVIIPAFNEARTLPSVLVAVSRALPGVEKEVIVIDDGSRDGTREWIMANFPTGPRSGSRLDLDAAGNLVVAEDGGAARTVVRPVFHDGNRGKGACVITGLAAAEGQVIVIQDADLEYDPADWAPMYDAIITRSDADVVYGTRFRGGRDRWGLLHHYVANRVLSFAFSAVYGQALSDIEVCYKMMTAEVKDSLALTCPDFGCEIQISAQIALSRRWRVQEVGISYVSRSHEEGKKIGWRDGLKALYYLLAFRFPDVGIPSFVIAARWRRRGVAGRFDAPARSLAKAE